MTYPFVTGLRLDVEDPSLLPAGNVLNQVKNTNGGQGGYGWITPAAGRVYGIEVTPGGLRLLTYESGPFGGPSTFYTEPAQVTPGGPYTAGWTTEASPPAYFYRATLTFFDAAGASVGSSSTGVIAGGAGADPTFTVTVPAGAATVRLTFDVYGNSAGADPATQTRLYLSDVRMGPVNSRAKISPGPLYTNLLTSATSITIEREELNVGTLTATVPDAAYDPALNTLLRPGRRVRVVTSTGVSVYTGKLSGASVKYDPRITGPQRAQISLTAVDAIADLANVARPAGVRLISQLRAVLEGAGVPWRINNNPDQIPPLAPITRNDSASVLDQVVLTRDSVHGYAWLSRGGVFYASEAGLMPGAVFATFDETSYGDDLDVSFDVERCINVVTIKLLRVNAATGETVEVSYGPYRRQSSIDQWGPRSAEFTVHGLTDDDATMAAYAEEVFNANATPTMLVNSLSLCVEAPTDFAAALDLYSKVRVTNTAAAIDQSPRVTKLTHRITPKNWIVEVGFGRDGGVAAPLPSPPLTGGGGGASPSQQVGRQASGTFTPGVPKAVAVTFPVPFASVPEVFANVRASTPELFSAVTVSDQTLTGCTLNVVRSSGTGTTNIAWLALV